MASAVAVQEGGTSWWVPVAVAAAAAAASYAAAWWLKRRDVERENAFRAASLVDNAELLSSSRERYAAEGGVNTLLRLLQQARIRAQPLSSTELDDRFQAALDYVIGYGLRPPGQPEPVGAWRLVNDAVANVREGLIPFLAAPRFLPGRAVAKLRSFPTVAELRAMPAGDEEWVAAILDWQQARG